MKTSYLTDEQEYSQLNKAKFSYALTRTMIVLVILTIIVFVGEYLSSKKIVEALIIAAALFALGCIVRVVYCLVKFKSKPQKMFKALNQERVEHELTIENGVLTYKDGVTGEKILIEEINRKKIDDKVLIIAAKKGRDMDKDKKIKDVLVAIPMRAETEMITKKILEIPEA